MMRACIGSSESVSVSKANSSAACSRASQASNCSCVSTVSYSPGAARAASTGAAGAARRARVSGGGAAHAAALAVVAFARSAGAAFELAQRLLEAVARVQRAQVLDVPRAQHQVGGRAVQREVGLDGDQRAVERQARQRGAQVLADLAGDLARTRDHLIERAVLAEPLRRGLGSAFVHAGHVVDAVAHQREEIDDLVRPHAELVDHASPPNPFGCRSSCSPA